MNLEFKIDQFCKKSSKRNLCVDICFFAPIAIICVGGAIACVVALCQETSMKSLFSFVVLAIGAFFASRALFRSITQERIIRIVPFFDKKGAHSRCFSSGRFIAENRTLLDNLAISSNCLTISHFISIELQPDAEPKWHSPYDLIQTADSLLSQISQKPRSFHSRQALIQEIKKLRLALENCKKNKIQLCLVIRTGKDLTVSPVEMDRLPGTFW